MNELSNEDALRLNVLLCQDVKAIRISESQMTLDALLDGKEVSIKLNANCNKDRYVKLVKEFLSSTVLNSPAGFPVFLKRWTRMGQMQHENISDLLKIGEPEAIVAITYSNSLSIEQATHAWWAYPSVECARQLLTHKNISESELAPVLARFLLEFLPFETESEDIIQTVKLLLQCELMDDENKNKLWLKGKRKAAYLIGYLQVDSRHIPLESEQHEYHVRGIALLKNDRSQFYLSKQGQSYTLACINALERFSDQNSAVLLFKAIREYYSQQALITQKIKHNIPTAHIQALQALAEVSQADLIPVLSRSNAVGSVLRKKLVSTTDRVKMNLTILMN